MKRKQAGQIDSAGLMGLGLGFAAIAAWITHVIVCLSAGKWGFLIAGALFFPIAIIHGVGIWFSAW